MTDNTTIRQTYVDDDGLWIPPALREFTTQVVFRTPRATIQYYEPGTGELDRWCSLIDESHFGDVADLNEPLNPGLAPNVVRIERQGERPAELEEVRHGE